MKIWNDLKWQYHIGGVVQKLIFWNIGASLFFFLLKGLLPGFYQMLLPWFSLSADPRALMIKPWTLISYAFLHAGLIHLLFNLLVLHFVGRLFTTYFTQVQFGVLYFLGAITGGVFYLLGGLLMATGSVLVGASAAIMAPMIALAVYAPFMEIRLLLIGVVKMWHIAALIVLLDIIQLSTQNTGGHLSHLGGAFIGFVYIKLLQSGTDLSKGVQQLLLKIKALFTKPRKHGFKKVYVNKNRGPSVKKGSNPLVKTVEQQKIDEILDKISSSGYESLTKEEKEFLFKVGK